MNTFGGAFFFGYAACYMPFAALESVKGCVLPEPDKQYAPSSPEFRWSQSCLSKPVPLKSALFVQLPLTACGVLHLFISNS